MKHAYTHTDEWKVAVLGELPCVLDSIGLTFIIHMSLGSLSVTIHNVKECTARLERRWKIVNVTKGENGGGKET